MNYFKSACVEPIMIFFIYLLIFSASYCDCFATEFTKGGNTFRVIPSSNSESNVSLHESVVYTGYPFIGTKPRHDKRDNRHKNNVDIETQPSLTHGGDECLYQNQQSGNTTSSTSSDTADFLLCDNSQSSLSSLDESTAAEERVLHYDMRTCPSSHHDRDLTSFPSSQEFGTRPEPVRIRGRKECFQPTAILVDSPTNLDVEVGSCCVFNCTHEISVKASNNSTHFVLFFTEFNVPGRNSVTKVDEKKCTESLDIVQTYRSHRNDSLVVHDTVGSYCGSRKPTTTTYIRHSEMKLLLRLFDNKECIDRISFKVTIVPCAEYQYKTCSSDDYVRLTHDHGHISTPGINVNRQYPNNLACKWKVTVLPGKLIGLKVTRFQLGKGDVLVIKARNDNIMLNASTHAFPPSIAYTRDAPFSGEIVLPSNECTIEFTSDECHTDDGIELTYQSVNHDRFIPVFDNLTLDCSRLLIIPASIKCNYDKDCADGRDEEWCPYAHHNNCLPPSFAFANHCYRVVHRPGESVSWKMADDDCQKRGAYLLSLNTVKERTFFERIRKKFKLGCVFLGLRRKYQFNGCQMYRRLWTWRDETIAFYLPDEFRFESTASCSLLCPDYFLATECHDQKENVPFICEHYLKQENVVSSTVQQQPKFIWSDKIDVFKCVSGELISIDRQCDFFRDCLDNSDELGCGADAHSIKFSCTNSYLLGYSFVCNGIRDCWNNLDELTCTIPPVADYMSRNVVPCDNRGMLLETHRECDGTIDCWEGADEKMCDECKGNTTLCPNLYCMPNAWLADDEMDCPVRNTRGEKLIETNFTEIVVRNAEPPGIVIPDGYGKVFLRTFTDADICPPTHFQCLDGFCIPINMLCNQVFDCPHREDEEQETCNKACRGTYKCKQSYNSNINICIHFNMVCDRIYDCPQKDDEIMCRFKERKCPYNCTCLQNEMRCGRLPSEEGNRLDVSSFSISFAGLHSFRLRQLDSYSLVHLNVSHNKIQAIGRNDLNYSNLFVFDASFNEIAYLSDSTFQLCTSIRTLLLSSNNLKKQKLGFLQDLPLLNILDLSRNEWVELEPYTFSKARELRQLILKDMKITNIHYQAFLELHSLAHLDLSGNDIIFFHSKMFIDNGAIMLLLTDNFRLCCPHIAPPGLTKRGTCTAPSDEISSCTDMLRSDFLRGSLWTIALLTIVGNLWVMYHRIFRENGRKVTFRILITCLALSDFLMGVYLSIIGIADALYRDYFLAFEERWRESFACQAAGYLCVLSSEASSFLILVVTLDRLVAIALPMRPHLQLTKGSAIVVSIAVWTISLVIATVPLVPPFAGWKLYSQLSVGVPLPITRDTFPGIQFAYSIFIVLNMVIFGLVVIGQIIIWISIKRRSKFFKSEARLKQDLNIARRLFMVVLTDCLCWIPISVMGLMGKQGVPIPGFMYVVSTVFILPINSALNPFLYTLNNVILKRKDRQCSIASGRA